MAEVIGAADIFLGINAVDYSGYPDCRPQFLKAFEQAANLGTKEGSTGSPFKLHAPLIELSKKEIIEVGTQLGVEISGPVRQVCCCFFFLCPRRIV